MFEVGQLIQGTSLHQYVYTTSKSLCIVEDIVPNGNLTVSVVAHQNRYDSCYHTEVKPEYFELCSYARFIEQYPNAYVMDNYTAETLMSIDNQTTTKPKEETKMELRMNKEATYELTEEERKALRDAIDALLTQYNYHPTDEGINAILDEWVKNKGWMIELFKKHPNYNGRYQIAFDADYNRTVDMAIVYYFVKYLKEVAREMLLEEERVGCFTYREVYNIVSKLRSIKGLMADLTYYAGGEFNVSVKGQNYPQIVNELNQWNQKLKDIKDNPEVYVYDNYGYNNQKYRLYSKFLDVCYYLERMREHIADENFANNINALMPDIKAVSGQKVSRIVGKICRVLGVDKHPDYNREFAKYSDTINPLAIKRHTILSCNPIDYLTMSFGNSWASCHTIDKDNVRNMPDNYNGCYSSGTLSYMLDNSSFVFYTVDKGYDGNEYELQDKINRNMFHIGEDKLIQARVYPQANDGEGGIYKQIREIAQKVIADCLGVSNMWKNVKGTNECGAVIRSLGTHYRDYTSFGSCNVSYLKSDENTEYINKNSINVGHDPICPCCGEKHSYVECIECESCYDDAVKCADCGYSYDREDMYHIDGRWYCDDCCFYCEYHNEYEVGESTYVENYGTVCDDSLNNNDFIYCERCDEWHYNDSRCIETEDGTTFCCSECAENAGYVYIESADAWYDEDATYYCEHCERYVLATDWNSELECCSDCEDEVRENTEEDAVEREMATA